MIQLIRGFKDILPGEMKVWQNVNKVANALFHDFGYLEICTPILEKTDLFARSIGASTDIVEKEMYTFTDRNGKLITLRPEATASIVRAYIEHKMYAKDPVMRLYNSGPMFRRERPQKGRYRQFYQIDVEVFGIKDSYIDVELIFMINSLFNKLLIGSTTVHLNTLGCGCCRPLFKNHLIEFISKSSSILCSDCIRRKEKNPLRILDCKTKSCREVIRNVNPIVDFLCSDCKDHFDNVVNLLYKLDVPFKMDQNLVRGLDYYNRTTFEIYHNDSPSMSAIAGGGRYDGLVHSLGGPNTPAIGFAIGLNRLVEVMISRNPLFSTFSDLFFAVLGEECMKLAFGWQMKLNNTGIRVVMGHFRQNLKSQMKQANRLKVSYVLIIGEQELSNGEVVLRQMNSGSQFCIPITNILEHLKNKIFNSKNNLPISTSSCS